MSAPYLNRGESIVLTTGRMTIGSGQYDAILTNARLILMDSQYVRFEPKMIHFPAILTVKSGKVSTGEPAVILTLDAPCDLSGSEQVSLIFSQQPGEHRVHERELWVKKLIQLVVAAREQGEQNTVLHQKKTGMQPSVRRWVAPEQPRPHSSIEKPLPSPPEVVVTEEPYGLESLLEEEPPAPPEPPREEVPDTAWPVITAQEQPEETLPPDTVPEDTGQIFPDDLPEETDQAPPDDLPGTEPLQVPESVPAEPVPAGGSEAAAFPEPTGDSGSPSSFESTVLAAAQSLQEQAEAARQTETDSLHQPQPDAGKDMHSADREEKPAEVIPSAGMEEIPAEDVCPDTADEIVIDRGVTRTSPLPVPDRHSEAPAHRHLPTPGQARELSGTYTPEIPVTGIPAVSREDEIPAPAPAPRKDPRPEREGRPVILTAVFVLIAVIILLGGVVLTADYLQAYLGGTSGGTTAPVVTVTQAPAAGPVSPLQAGVRVNVIYPGPFTGTVGNPGLLHRVSGTGNRTFPVLMTSHFIEAAVQKQDNTGDALTVEIYDNSTLLVTKTVTAPMGEIQLLIDTRTARPPGPDTVTSPAGNPVLPGNDTPNYY